MCIVEGYVWLTLRYEREGNKWVGICHELSTSTFARTLKRCQQELNELVIEHLNVLDQAGQRDRFFHDWGIELHPAHVTPTQVTLHGHGDPTWNDFLKGVMGSGEGPLLQPRAFPIDNAKGKQAAHSGI
jgi:hypothetical protein